MLISEYFRQLGPVLPKRIVLIINLYMSSISLYTYISIYTFIDGIFQHKILVKDSK